LPDRCYWRPALILGEYVYGFSSHCNRKVRFLISASFKEGSPQGFAAIGWGTWVPFELLGKIPPRPYFFHGAPIMQKTIPMRVNPAHRCFCTMDKLFFFSTLFLCQRHPVLSTLWRSGSEKSFARSLRARFEDTGRSKKKRDVISLGRRLGKSGSPGIGKVLADS
jgi:hypothetical protein